MKQYQIDMAVRDYWKATLAIRECAELVDDAELKALVVDAEIKSYIQDIDHSIRPHTRLRSLEALIRDYPQIGKGYAWRLPAFQADVDRESAENKRRLGQNTMPRLGATAAWVLENSWGQPLRRNRRTNADGVREQWVYPNNRYLYFENGVLVEIQD